MPRSRKPIEALPYPLKPARPAVVSDGESEIDELDDTATVDTDFSARQSDVAARRRARRHQAGHPYKASNRGGKYWRSEDIQKKGVYPCCWPGCAHVVTDYDSASAHLEQHIVDREAHRTAKIREANKRHMDLRSENMGAGEDAADPIVVSDEEKNSCADQETTMGTDSEKEERHPRVKEEEGEFEEMTPLLCPREGCMYKGTSKKSLMRHLMRADHMGLKIVCPGCEAAYARPDALTRHLNSLQKQGKLEDHLR